MNENPDNQDYIGVSNGVAGRIYPSAGKLRFVERTEGGRLARILQVYEWCNKEGDYRWFDVPMVRE